MIGELTPLELAIVKHFAALYLSRSPLKDVFDIDDYIELLEMRKNSFWGKIFKGGADKKNVKKKGVFHSALSNASLSCPQASSAYRWNS